MRKTFRLLNRFLLVVGVLVALTPCAACQKTLLDKISTLHSCPMAGKMDCCRKAKAPSPLCQVMDQSSIQAASAHVDVAVASTVSVQAPGSPLSAPSRSSFSFPSGISPPRSSLVLRI